MDPPFNIRICPYDPAGGASSDGYRPDQPRWGARAATEFTIYRAPVAVSHL